MVLLAAVGARKIGRPVVDEVAAVTKDAQDMWAEKLGSRYRRTKVTLFRDAIQSACGFAQAATGPFYCPEDGQVYLTTDAGWSWTPGPALGHAVYGADVIGAGHN